MSDINKVGDPTTAVLSGIEAAKAEEEAANARWAENRHRDANTRKNMLDKASFLIEGLQALKNVPGSKFNFEIEDLRWPETYRQMDALIYPQKDRPAVHIRTNVVVWKDGRQDGFLNLYIHEACHSLSSSFMGMCGAKRIEISAESINPDLNNRVRYVGYANPQAMVEFVAKMAAQDYLLPGEQSKPALSASHAPKPF